MFAPVLNYDHVPEEPPVLSYDHVPPECRQRTLREVAGAGHLEHVTSLLSKGADVNGADERGWTALHLAAGCGSAPVVYALLANGAEMTCTNNEGCTALHYAAQNGHAAVVEALLARGADVNCTNKSGETPLHGAAMYDELSIALELWRAGADPLKQNNNGKTPLSILRKHSYVAQQMCTVPRQQPSPSFSQLASDHNDNVAPLNELQKVWLHAKTSVITQQQLLAALKAEHVTSFSNFVLAHYLLLLAVRQRVLTRSQLTAFGGSRDYLLENVYLPVTKFPLTVEQKFWLTSILSYAEGKNFIRNGNAVLVKIVADLRSEIRQTRLDMHSALVSVAREINCLHQRVYALEQWTTQAAKKFQHLCEGQQQMLSDMKNLGASLQQLHGLLRKQQRNRTIAGLLSFCLAIIPVIGGVLAGASFSATELAFGFNAEQVSSVGTIAVNEISAVDISNFHTVSVLTSDQCISKLDPVTRQRIEAVMEHTDFKTLPNLQARLAIVIEDLRDSEYFNKSQEEEEEAELRERFTVLSSRSDLSEQTVTAQDAVPELQHILQLHLSQTGSVENVTRDDVENVVLERMDQGSCLLDVDAFIKSFNQLRKMYPTVIREPPELRERFRIATRSRKVLRTNFAKRLLHVLFEESGSGAYSSRAPLSFKRTSEDWNDSDVDALLADHERDDNVLDEEGFVKVGMKILFA